METLPIVRTVTAFVSPGSVEEAAKLAASAGSVLRRAHDDLAANGFEIQTVRVALSPFETWAGPAAVDGFAERLAEAARACLAAADAAFGDGPPLLMTVGPATSPEGAAAIPGLIRSTERTTASLDLGRETGAAAGASAAPAMRRAAARVIAELATTTDGAAGNFSFAALARVPPCVPFFPAAFAPPRPIAAPAQADAAAHGRAVGEPPAAVLVGCGLQHVNVTVPAAEAAAKAAGRPLEPAELSDAVVSALLPHVRRVETVMEAAAAGTGASYVGMDTSFAPAPGAPSVLKLFEAAGCAGPAGSGAIAVASALTAACKLLSVAPAARPRLIGYCGLMLPPLEDDGLAAAAIEGALPVQSLLATSSVCGIGLDTVPVAVPGLFGDDAGPVGAAPGPDVLAPLERTLGDVASLALRLAKPLSCRLFPYPAPAGALTAFDHPHLCNAAVLALP